MIHHTRVKRAYHADPENAEWTAQRDPTDPRETKTILKKKEKKILDEPPPLRMKPHNQLLLLGLINVHIPTWTSTILPTAGYVGLCVCL